LRRIILIGVVAMLAVVGTLPAVALVADDTGQSDARSSLSRSGFFPAQTEYLPTSKEECKKGGWKNFPSLKNQGDCIAFVATEGENPPSGGR
jgi:hypothetical protein